MRLLLPLILLPLLSLPGLGQEQQAATDAAAEFPALQFLPEGSVIEGISIPRYEGHRVSALLLADKLKVQTRSTVILEKLSASLYANDGTQTEIIAGNVEYDFATKTASTTGNAQVQDPRVSASGKGVIFNTSTRKGFLHGPVKTTISTARLTDKKGRKK